MLFSSPVFFVFFAVYFTLHLVIPARWRLYLIIAGSTAFYAWWKPEYIWLPYLLMAIAYFGVIWMMHAKLEPGRKRRAAVVIALLFVPLVVFKYTNFIYNDVLGVLTRGGKVLDLTLPLGVSFVTFALTAYIVDIYRGKFPPQTRPQTVLAYVLFFPHLIAGPILRPDELIPQLEHPRRKKPILPVAAFTIGLVKKLVFADTIAGLVDSAYSHAGTATAPEALLAIYGFSVQIYCDFSGYTDMAIGLAMLLGVRLPNNLAQPYCADSIVDFWRRWHKILSFWLRDYLYIPLGGNREGKVYEIRNIMITMALGGLWHGASWTFVIWGVLHGAAVSSVHAAKKLLRWNWLDRLPRRVGVLVTFHFVTLVWVFFRAPGLVRRWISCAQPWWEAGRQHRSF
jgi:alginate O-acetyltransferase complex protein AlgI